MTQRLSASAAEDLRAHLREWFRSHPEVHFDNLEAAEECAVEVGRVAAECAFESAAGVCGTRAGYCGAWVACACGGRAKFVGYRRRWVRGQPGEVGVTRAYYHCRGCHRGLVPWDREQGLDQGVLTPRVKSQVAELGARGVFQDTQEVLERLLGIPLAVSTLEDVVLEVGGRLRAAENERGRSLFEEERLPTADPLLAEVLGKRAYLSLDAAKAHIDGGWHDIKVAAFYVGIPPGAKTAAGRPWDQVGSKRYLAIQEDADRFAKRVYTFALRLGCERASELVVLGDGAEWIWKIVAHHFSDAEQILDFYHASEHVWEIARVVFGERDELGAQWAERCTERLQEAGPRGLLVSLQELRQRGMSAPVRAAVIGEVQYFRRNRRRMQYPAYRAKGMMIGSGPVEAACKSVVGGRLKGTGMRWSAAGADAILAIRTEVLAGRYEELARYARAA
jgi:hypothetical protein